MRVRVRCAYHKSFIFNILPPIALIKRIYRRRRCHRDENKAIDARTQGGVPPWVRKKSEFAPGCTSTPIGRTRQKPGEKHGLEKCGSVDSVIVRVGRVFGLRRRRMRLELLERERDGLLEL